MTVSYGGGGIGVTPCPPYKGGKGVTSYKTPFPI